MSGRACYPAALFLRRGARFRHVRPPRSSRSSGRPSHAWMWIVTGVLLLAGPAGGREPQTLKLRFPRFTVRPGGSPEVCFFVRVPTQVPFDLASFEITNRGAGGSFGVRHFLVYLYAGEHLDEFSRDAGRIVASRACLDLGPADRDRRQLIASGAAARSRGALPPGLVLRLAPVPAVPGGTPDGIGLLFDANWVNGTSGTRRGSTRVVLHRARPEDVRRVALPIFETTAELGLRVPPGLVVSSETSTAALNAARPGEAPLRDAWEPGITAEGAPPPSGDACVLVVTGHMHKRGRFLGVDLIGPDGLPHNPPDGPDNPFDPGRIHLFASSDYADPGAVTFTPPQLLHVGEALHYACWTDNGVTITPRLGCEEIPGQAPGTPPAAGGDGPAKPCHATGSSSPECPPTDAAYPDRRFTGACVLANVVAGTTPDDEACALAGAYFDPIPGAAPGAECDVTQLPLAGNQR